jgi:hypothetical protein
MSLPVNRDTPESIMRDMLNRIRALEAKRRSASTGGFGESGEFTLDPGFTAPGTLEWDPIYDPHAFFAGGQPTRITIPNGLGGVYNFSVPFFWTAL